MLTSSGRMVLIENSVAPSLSDIGRSLGRTIRWRGQTTDIITVLGHSLTVATLIQDERVKIHGLLHDAAESIVGDMPSPIKTGDFRALERHMLDRIYQDLGVTPPTREEEEVVHRADLQALVAEAHVLGHRDFEVIESQVGVSLDECEDAIELTRLNAEFSPEFIVHAVTSEQVFEKAYETYMAVHRE